MINYEADEFIKELFYSLKKRYQNNLESIKSSEFLFDYVHLLYYKCHKKSESWWIIYKFSLLHKKQKNNNKSYQSR